MLRLSPVQQDGKARVCNLLLNGNLIETPVYMPVGTLGSIKALDWNDILSIGYRHILANTYHLYLRPGLDVIKGFGSLKKFINWNGTILTDSGGFQIYSLSKLNKLTEEGFYFQSPINGSRHFFSPEKVIDIQLILGSDIMMPLDECISLPAEYNYIKSSIERTYRWLVRSKQYFEKKRQNTLQSLFGIIQGGIDKNLRKLSTEKTLALNMDGYSIGGLSVGEDNSIMYDITEFTVDLLPANKPRYLMGVGKPVDIINCVSVGIDMFDCVLPTRNARNGTLLTFNGNLNIKRAAFKNDETPIEKDCKCYTCKNFSKAYLRHLYKSRELIVYRYLTIHNLFFMYRFMKNIRESIKDNNFKEYRRKFLSNYAFDK